MILRSVCTTPWTAAGQEPARSPSHAAALLGLPVGWEAALGLRVTFEAPPHLDLEGC